MFTVQWRWRWRSRLRQCYVTWRYCTHLSLVIKSKRWLWISYSFGSPFLALAVLCPCQRLTNSTLKTLLQCFAPALPTQEPQITVSIAFLVFAVGSASFSRHDSLPSSSTSIFGCTSRARLLGEGRVSLVTEHGEDGLIGNKTATYSISKCKVIQSGISARPMASILRKPLPNCDNHLSQQRGWPLYCTD